MGIATQTARKCFSENLKLLAHPETEPEKYNLYSGLTALAQAIAALETRIAQVEDTLSVLNRNINMLRR